jgi:aldehyde:ferredoxin oxidoreductase
MLEKRASDISDLVRLFNIREGLKPEDDSLPKYLNKPLKKTGQTIGEEELKGLVREYYRLRGWDEQGIPIKTGFKGSRGQGFQ